MKRKLLPLDEAKHQKLNILPPNINESHWYYKATSKGIYLSLGAIKGVGYQSVKRLLMKDIIMASLRFFLILHEEFLKGVKSRKLLEALILVGAFDHFGKNRATLLQTIDQVLDTASDVEQDDMLFDILTPETSL